MAEGCHYITGRILGRIPYPNRVEYLEEPSSVFTFDELFNHEIFGHTACADNGLSGCLFSFSYGPQGGRRTARAGAGQDVVQEKNKEVEAQKELILQEYSRYLNSYEECPVSQAGKLSTERPVKVLIWGEVSSVAEVRNVILDVLERLDISCGELHKYCDEMIDTEELTGPLVKKISETKGPKDMMQELLLEEAERGKQNLLSFEEGLKKADEELRMAGHSLRFLFFVPQAEYQKIRSYGCFLPQQIRSVLCVTSISYGNRLEYWYIRDKRLQEIIEQSEEIYAIINNINLFLEQDTGTLKPEEIRVLKAYRDRLYKMIDKGGIDRENQKENDGPQRGGPPTKQI